MILNCVDSNGNLEDLILPDVKKEKSEETKNQIQKMRALKDTYQKKLDACYAKQEADAAFDSAQCIAKTEDWLFLSASMLLAEMFFTRDNYCYLQYTRKLDAGKNPYFVDAFQRVMIHSPASCSDALSFRRSMNHYSSDKKKQEEKKKQGKTGEKPKEVGTHFIVDGDTGNIYCLLPLHCHANHCGKPMMADNVKSVPNTDSLNHECVAIDIGEPSGVQIISEAAYSSFPKSYKSEWTRIGHHYYGVAEKLDNAAYQKLSKEERADWVKAEYEKEKEDKTKVTVIEWFRTTPEVRQSVLTGAKNAYQAAAELAASLCLLFQIKPFGMSKKLSFDGSKKKGKNYSDTKEEVPGSVIGHVEGFKNFYMASNHGDPENLWKVENTGYTMDSFRTEVAKYYEQLTAGKIPIHPLLDLLVHQTYEARLSAEATTAIKPEKGKNKDKENNSGKKPSEKAKDKSNSGAAPEQTAFEGADQPTTDDPKKPFVPFDSWAYTPPTGEERLLIEIFRKLATAISDGSGKTPQDYYQAEAGLKTKKAAADDIKRFDTHLQTLSQLYPPEIAKELLG